MNRMRLYLKYDPSAYSIPCALRPLRACPRSPSLANCNSADSNSSVPSAQATLVTDAAEATALEVELSDTIGDVKAKIQAEFGIAEEQQRLIFGATPLHDNSHRLSDYSIGDRATLLLVMAQRGMSYLPTTISGQTRVLERPAWAEHSSLRIASTAPIRAAAFSPSAAGHCAAASADSITLWDSATGSIISTFCAPCSDSLAFSPDGSRLASASADGTVSLFDVGAGRELWQLRGRAPTSAAVAFSAERILLFLQKPWSMQTANAEGPI